MSEDSAMRIAVFGSTGMLGSEVVSECEKRAVQVVRCASSSGDLRNYALVDITSPESVKFFIQSWEPTVIVNCAAYTQVDLAEEEYDKCFAVNAEGPRTIAQLCALHNVFLVHISTDYVFGGFGQEERERAPFSENETCAPCGIYGWSKYFGELAVRSTLPNSSLIVRTSWLHGHNGRNFIDTIAKVAKEKGELRVVNDQFGSLTYAPWLADILLRLIELRTTGIIHACARDEQTWHSVAETIIDELGIDCKLFTQSTLESKRPAPRPAYSKLDTAALALLIGEDIPTCLDFVKAQLRID